jgi:glycosyltransferase involved in cell wall biosynthesis
VHLTALVEAVEHVCCRYRILAFRPWLAQAGVQLDLRPLPAGWWSALALRATLKGTDVVLVQRKLLNPLQLHLLRRAAGALLFDFDDAVFLRDSYAAKGLYSRRRRRRFAAMVRAADALIAGNAFLAEQAVVAGAGDRVHVVPTCIEPRDFSLANHDRAGVGVQLVWIGSSSTLQGLEAVRPLLEQIGEALPGLRLKLICDRFLELQRLPVVECPWTPAAEGTELASADIGISWLPDDAWSRGKCGLKILQYMAAGLPVVANPVGVQGEMVRHGETGFLVETPEEWITAIGRLRADPYLRRHMGQAGRRLIEREYSVQMGAARWLHLLQHLRRRNAA